jgi:hypothetical protein
MNFADKISFLRPETCGILYRGGSPCLYHIMTYGMPTNLVFGAIFFSCTRKSNLEQNNDLNKLPLLFIWRRRSGSCYFTISVCSRRFPLPVYHPLMEEFRKPASNIDTVLYLSP